MRSQDYVAHTKADRAAVVHHKDNLKMEGQMESRAARAKVIAAERASQIKHDDNLKMEGSMNMQRRGTITLSSNKETATKKEDNLKMEGSFETRTAASVTQNSKMESAYSSTSNLSTTALKSNQSSGISGAINQTGKEKADISAISKDKFVSSLRESNGVNIAQQKEMSVIDYHRKQSLQNQKRETWDTRTTGYSVGEAHTGRTAAYGGRDYEYSSSMAAAQSSRGSSAAMMKTQQQSSSVSRQSQSSSSWSAQEQSSSTRMASQQSASMSAQSRSSLSAQHQLQSSSSSQQQSSSAVARSSRQDTSGLSGFRAEQVSGYARNLGTSQSGTALIKGDQVIRHETGSASAYQSVAQQSYRGQQVEARSSQSRRKTWAESSLQHGGAAAIGQSIYAQDFHQHSCPASKVYTNTSPYKYERQSSSGHKLFKERGENR